MAFVPKAWKNRPSRATPIDAAALVDLEERVYQGALEDARAEMRGAIPTSTRAGDYAIVAADGGGRIRMTNAAAAVVSVGPLPDAPVGTTVEIARAGAGTVTLVAVGGVALLTPDGVGTSIASTNASATLVKDTADPEAWVVSGYLS